MILQKRDKLIIALLSRYGILSSAQIAVICFPQVAKTAVLKRLRMLEKAKLIQRCPGLPNGMSAWSLTTFGAKSFGGDTPFRYTDQNTILHEVTLSQVRLSLEGIDLAKDWVSELEIKRERGKEFGRVDRGYLVPDGIFTFNQGQDLKVVAIELELTPKNHLRYIKLFNEYAAKDSLDYVWYIVGIDSIGKTIESCWRKIRRKEKSPKLILSQLSDIFIDIQEAEVKLTENGKVWSLRQFFVNENEDVLVQGVNEAGTLKLSASNPKEPFPNPHLNLTPD